MLIAMGYGYDKDSGIVVGGSHDGGIDGIIFEDKLELDKIYLQAKKYKIGNTVGRKDLQAFVGAMQNVHKGVFITTSSFTKEAVVYAKNQQQKSLKLIDGAIYSNHDATFSLSGCRPVVDRGYRVTLIVYMIRPLK